MTTFYDVTGTATKLNKQVDRFGMYKLQIMPGAFDKFLSGDRGSNPMNQDVVLTTDHNPRAYSILAREGTDTLLFSKEKDNLRFAASIATGDDATSMQQDVVNSIKQKSLRELSVGLLIQKYAWNLEDDNNPILEIQQAGLRELSLVTFGAMEKDATIDGLEHTENTNESVSMTNIQIFEDSHGESLELSHSSLLDSLAAAKAAKEQSKLASKARANEIVGDLLDGHDLS